MILSCKEDAGKLTDSYSAVFIITSIRIVTKVTMPYIPPIKITEN